LAFESFGELVLSAFGESLSFGCPKESNQRKGHLAAIAPQGQGSQRTTVFTI
jgi:hypothetical protein